MLSRQVFIFSVISSLVTPHSGTWVSICSSSKSHADVHEGHAVSAAGRSKTQSQTGDCAIPVLQQSVPIATKWPRRPLPEHQAAGVDRCIGVGVRRHLWHLSIVQGRKAGVHGHLGTQEFAAGSGSKARGHIQSSVFLLIQRRLSLHSGASSACCWTLG